LGRFVVEKLHVQGYAHVVVPRRVHYDLTRRDDIDRLFEDAQPSVIVHLAAVVDNPVGCGNSAACFRDNVLMSVQLMEAARQHGVRKMVCLGSACSYSREAPTPLREEDFWSGYPHESRAAYSMAKKLPLVQAQIYRQQYGLDAIFLIPTNLYGPGDNFDSKTSYVIPSLIRRFTEAADTRQPSVDLYGDPGTTRDFLFVDDAAEGILLALERYDGSDPVNLATGVEVSLRELAEILTELTRFNGKVIWQAAERPGPARRWLDGSRAEREFGFRPRTGLREGLRATIAWYRDTLAGAGGFGRAAMSRPRG
jgi:GDP-L-fucose synthase